MNTKNFIFLVTLLLLSNFSMANESLAKSKNCLACHNIDRKVIGPSFKSIAQRYAGQRDAATKLATKIIKGGGGVWGPVPMPANTQVSPAQAKELAAWVLAR